MLNALNPTYPFLPYHVPYKGVETHETGHSNHLDQQKKGKRIKEVLNESTE